MPETQELKKLDIPLTPITGSSNLTGHGYHAESSTLDLRFTSGAVHRYSGVPAEINAAFQEAPSKGKYFASSIRNVYPAVRLEPEAEAETPPAEVTVPTTSRAPWPFPVQP